MPYTSLIFKRTNPDSGKQLATGGKGGKIKLWDIQGNLLNQFPTRQKITAVTSGNELKQFEMQQQAIKTKRVKFSPNRKQLATFGTDGQVRVWQVGDTEELRQQICYLVRGYLQENPNLNNSDKHLCDDFNKQVPSPTPSSNNRQISYEQALSDCRQANQFNSTSVDAYINKGWIYHKQGNYEQAINNYTRSIALNPNKYKAYSNRGAAYIGQKNYQKAVEDYSKAISLNPTYVDAYINRGLAYYYQGNYQQVIADYTKAIKLAPNNASAYKNRALAYTRLGNQQAAQADKRKAASLSQR